jgi:nucleotide-binding universal stress UspA family protein
VGFVVVGVDGSSASIEALVWGMRFAQSAGYSVVAVTGYDVPWTIFLAPTYEEDDYARDASEMLWASVARAREEVPGVAVEERLVQERPGLALTMASHGAELLVVGAHGHSGMPDVHIGSVANACVNHAHCPVVVHRESQAPDVD